MSPRVTEVRRCGHVSLSPHTAGPLAPHVFTKKPVNHFHREGSSVSLQQVWTSSYLQGSGQNGVVCTSSLSIDNMEKSRQTLVLKLLKIFQSFFSQKMSLLYFAWAIPSPNSLTSRGSGHKVEYLLCARLSFEHIRKSNDAVFSEPLRSWYYY